MLEGRLRDCALTGSRAGLLQRQLVNMLLFPVSNAVAADSRISICLNFYSNAHEHWWAGLPRLGWIPLWQMKAVMYVEEEHFWLMSNNDSASMISSTQHMGSAIFRDPAKNTCGYAGVSLEKTIPADAGSILRICISFPASAHVFVEL